jgi:hypothetical protein
MDVSRLRLPLIVADLDSVTVFKLHPMPRIKGGNAIFATFFG